MVEEFNELSRLLELKWLSTLARLRPLQQQEQELKQQLEKIDEQLASGKKVLEEVAERSRQRAPAWLYGQAQVFQCAQQSTCSRMLSARQSVAKLVQQAIELELPLYRELAQERVRQGTASKIAGREKLRAARKLRSVSHSVGVMKGSPK